MLPVAALLFAVQVSSTPAGTPAPTPTTTPAAPAPTPTPVAAADPYRPRGLSELAKNRRLGRLTGNGAALVTTAQPEPATAGAAPVSSGPSAAVSAAARRAAMLRVEDLQDNGAVADGRVSVYGTVRNTGRQPLCRVRIFLRLYDDHDVLLSTGETTTDLKIVAAGEAVTFGGTVKAPPGLRGASERKPDPLVDGRPSTNWQRVGRVAAEIIDASDECF